MARPRRRGAFVSDRLSADPKFAALGERGKLGLIAQALLPHYFAASDDQGRAPADPVWVKQKAGSGIAALTQRLVSSVVALYAANLSPDGPWAIVYEAECESGNRQLIQWVDWHQHNDGLRYKEPSRYPPPSGWTQDEIRSWHDNPKIRGSKAWRDAEISTVEGGRSTEEREPSTVECSSSTQLLTTARARGPVPCRAVGRRPSRAVAEEAGASAPRIGRMVRVGDVLPSIVARMTPHD